MNAITADAAAASNSPSLTVLTGGSRGLGRAMAEQILKAPGPQRLLSIARRADDSLAALAREHGAELTQWTLDLADARPAADQLGHWLKSLDAQTFASATLINNAGTIAPPRPLADADAADVLHALRVGLEAPMLLTSAFLKATAAWPGARKVLNISSGLGRGAMGSQAPYCAAKAGMDHFSRAVALEQATLPNGAGIVSLAPGVIDTDMQIELRGSDATAFPDRARFVQMKEQGKLDSPADAARKVLGYLARADYGNTPVADVRDA